MESSHTPGPWTNSHSTGIIKLVDGRNVKIAETWHCYGSRDNPAASMPEAEANARLIAAAPDMLAALCQAREWMASIANANTFSRQCMLDRMAQADAPYAMVRSAIAKATGGEA